MEENVRLGPAFPDSHKVTMGDLTETTELRMPSALTAQRYLRSSRPLRLSICTKHSSSRRSFQYCRQYHKRRGGVVSKEKGNKEGLRGSMQRGSLRGQKSMRCVGPRNKQSQRCQFHPLNLLLTINLCCNFSLTKGGPLPIVT